MSPIESANEAKRKLLEEHGDNVVSCTVVLGDQGFRLDVVFKKRPKSIRCHGVDIQYVTGR